MLRSLCVLGVGCTLALGLVACGDDDEPPGFEARNPDEQAILDVVDRYEQATRDGDAALFCDEVLAGGGDAECERLIGEAMSDPDSDLASEEHVTVLEIEIDRDSAEVRIDDDNERYAVTFLREDGEWRMQVFD